MRLECNFSDFAARSAEVLFLAVLEWLQALNIIWCCCHVAFWLHLSSVAISTQRHLVWWDIFQILPGGLDGGTWSSVRKSLRIGGPVFLMWQMLFLMLTLKADLSYFSALHKPTRNIVFTDTLTSNSCMWQHICAFHCFDTVWLGDSKGIRSEKNCSSNPPEFFFRKTSHEGWLKTECVYICMIFSWFSAML